MTYHITCCVALLFSVVELAHAHAAEQQWENAIIVATRLVGSVLISFGTALREIQALPIHGASVLARKIDFEIVLGDRERRLHACPMPKLDGFYGDAIFKMKTGASACQCLASAC